MKNRVQQLRKSLNLSQQKLADLVKTSQQQIQRIEAGKVAVKLELATNLSLALGKPLEAVFPGISKAMKAVQKEIAEGYVPDISWGRMRNEVGVEGDPRIWTFQFLLRGHTKIVSYEINSADRDRLFSLIQDEKSDPDGVVQFIVFNTPNQVLAIQLSELVYCHFLNDMVSPAVTDDEDDPQQVIAYFCGREQPLSFSVDIDEGDPNDVVNEGPFEMILAGLEGYALNTERIHFLDSGESVFIRTGDLAMLTVPLWVIDPVEPEDIDE